MAERADTLAPAMRFSGVVALGGLLGEALDANHRGRLATFIVDEASPAIAVFAEDAVAANRAGDWYGEHAGKWLIAATRAALRAGDDALLARVTRVADWLVARQGADGYLGTYAPDHRFPVPAPPKPVTWDGAPARRTWDIWTHAYLMLGLVELWRATGTARYLAAACRIADLVGRTLDDGIAITDLGNHFGLSATVVLDPLVELYRATGDDRYRALAERVVAQAEAEPRNAFASMAAAGADPSAIATGKAYQLLWNYVGLAKLGRATGGAAQLAAVRPGWATVRDHPLSPGGAPRGGIAHRSREVFNAPGTFAPEAYVETCATMAWIQLNRELLAATGEAAFAEEIERSAYNDLLGAQAPNGEDWCYYSFPNGRRVHTTYWRCCKSSGAMALEELAPLAVALTADGAVAVNLLGPARATLDVPGIGAVTLTIATGYPRDGAIAVTVDAPGDAEIALDLRVPAWAEGATLKVGEEAFAAAPGGYARIRRRWRPGEVLRLDLPMRPRLLRARRRNVQESLAPDGSPVAQEVMRQDYVAVARGPLVYATGLVDGFKPQETLRFDGPPAPPADTGDVLELASAGRPPLPFVPYFEAGGREDGAWRLTWLALAPGTP